eukprot:3331624-Pyramimonas_sp.AAC.1
MVTVKTYGNSPSCCACAGGLRHLLCEVAYSGDAGMIGMKSSFWAGASGFCLGGCEDAALRRGLQDALEGVRDV